MQQFITHLEIPQLLKQALKHSVLKDVVFTQSYPDKAATVPTIVYQVVSRVLGVDGNETKKARLRAQESRANNIVNYWGQFTTVTYQFDLFADSNENVDKLMRQFEIFILESMPVLSINGVDSFIFYQQLKDYTLPVQKDIPCRSVQYRATLSEIYPRYVARIHQITLNHKMGGGGAFIPVVRGDGDSDVVGSGGTLIIQPTWILCISDDAAPVDPDYIVGVDYELSADTDGRAVITWTQAGKRPDPGAAYAVSYCIIDESHSSTLTF